MSTQNQAVENISNSAHQTKIKHLDELVINWHLTEACNYSCQYCYAHWDRDKCPKELIHSATCSKLLLEQIGSFFSPENTANPLRRDMKWSSVRINIAGGEPLLYTEKAIKLIKIAHQMGLKPSIITNGSRLTAEVIDELAPYLSTLGISVDSMNEDTNMIIGRQDRSGRQLSLHELQEIIHRSRRLNPSLKVKINTVVNRENHKESFHEALSRLTPDRWKVLQMLPILNDNLDIDTSAFNAFVARHNAFSGILVPESNEAMTESYIMIDPHGRFYQNSTGSSNGYDYSLPITEVGIERAYSYQKFSADKFSTRYDS